MGDFAVDTALTGSDGQYRAHLTPDWQHPAGYNGGYLSAIALRAAGTAGPDMRPASFTCQYLSVPTHPEVDVTVTPVRESRRARAVQVRMHEEGQTILEAQVWLQHDGKGLEHTHAPMPASPAPESLPSLAELLAGVDVAAPPPSLFTNWDLHVEATAPAEADGTAVPRALSWVRYRPAATFTDPFLDAARTIVPIDSFFFPAATRPHVALPGMSPYGTQSLDLTVQFHAFAPECAWLLCESTVPASGRGLASGYARVWTEDGTFVASGTSQLMWRRASGP